MGWYPRGLWFSGYEIWGEEVEERSFMRQNGSFTTTHSRRNKDLFKGFGFLELKDNLLEKNYRGEKYIRHMIRAVMRYDQKKMPA
jgi:hypothetical protein